MTASPPGSAYGRSQIVLLAIGFAALVAVGGASLWLVNRNAVYSENVARTLETRVEILRILSLAQDAETGQRGFLLTGDERYLRPYTIAVTGAQKELERLAALGDGSESFGADMRVLKQALDAKFAELAETIALQRAGRVAEALAVVETDRGRDAMLSVRRTIAALTAREDARLAKGSDELAWNGHVLVAVNLIGVALVAALASIGALLVRRQTRALDAAADQLRAANVGLEEAVLERTSELTSANDEIQRFAYIVSHDLRAPLVNVMGFTSELDAARDTLSRQMAAVTERAPELVQPDARLAVDEDLPEAIGFIRASTSKMDRLINAILKLSREGRRAVTPERVAVDEMVQAIADTLYTQTTDANAEIVVESGVPALVTDRMTLEQIFQNLIENAVKYLDRSRPGRIVVSGRRIGGLIEYAIADNGRGIDAKDHERVFELFRRAGAQDQPGEGLGLAFVRASVRRLGGTIRLASEPGAGSTFHLAFPAVFKQPTEHRAA